MSLIGRFEHLPKRPRSEEARPLLEKIASQVKPIMVKRGWKVGTLAEFFPSNPALLGLNTNSGERINIRLRPPNAPNDFYEYDQLVLVMLHELTHNTHGPHDAKFYKLLGELEEEYYELKRKGYSGDGFHSDGHHLPGLKRNAYEGRRVGLAAAEKRLAVQLSMGKGGRLGGGPTQGKSIREVVAEAAERRIKDDKTCATVHSAHEAQDEVRRAQEESVGVDAIDLERDPAGTEAGPSSTPASTRFSEAEDGVDAAPPKRSRIGAQGVSESMPNSPSRSIDRSNADVIDLSSSPSPPRPPRVTAAVRRQAAPLSPPPPPLPTEWACGTCTLLNPASYLACDVCGTERPPGFKSRQNPPRPADGGVPKAMQGWMCGFCAKEGIDWERWMCGECGWVRNFG